MNMGSKELAFWVSKFSKVRKDINKQLKKNKKDAKNTIKIILSPSTIYIPAICEISQKLGAEVCAQDVSLFEKGAYTGEIGAFQVKDFCKYAIVGHSERKENIETVIKKRDMCLSQGITPIVCFVNPNDLLKLHKDGVFMAWENPQNISKNGVYRAEDPAKISAIAKEIRKIIPAKTPLIYGGSVNEENIKEIAKIEEIDGVLVGNASLDSEIFAAIIRYYI